MRKAVSDLKRLVSLLVLAGLLTSMFGGGFGTLIAHAEDEVAAPAPEQALTAGEEIQEIAEEIGENSVEEIEMCEEENAQALEEENEFAEGVLSAESEGGSLVTLRFGAEARIPGDARLEVMEILPGSETYDSYIAQSAEALERSSETALVLDISILSPEGQELQPAAPVEVSIQSPELSMDESTQVVHFSGENGDEPELLDSVSDGALAFTTEGFSVYVIVPAPQPIPLPGALQSLSDIAEGQGYTISVSTASDTYYVMQETNELTKGFTLLSRGTDEAVAPLWYFERTGEEQFYLYGLVDGARRYLRVDQVWNTRFSFTETDPTAFRLEIYGGKAGAFYLYLTENGKNYALNLKGNDSGKGFQLYSANNGTNNGSRLEICLGQTETEDDPYSLDGESFGLISWQGGQTGSGILADSTGLSLRGLSVRTDPMDRSGKLYVAKNSHISFFTFRSEGEDRYTLSTLVEGEEMFLSIQGETVSLSASADASCLIQAIPGWNSRQGMIRLLGVESGKVLLARGDKLNAGIANDKDEWLNLAELSDFTEEDFVSYSAAKVSVSDTTNVSNGKRVILYTRVWNEAEKAYEFFVVDHNGELVRAYESGDSIVWIGTRINTAAWDFIQYRDALTDEINDYYELRNSYSGEYLAPQIRSAQILSENPIGINLNGRSWGDFHTAILAWDDPCYDYAGLKAEDGHLTAVPMAQADSFYFALMQSPDPNELTPVQTIDHSAAGLTMKLIDFNGSKLQNSVLGNSTFSQNRTVANLLSTDFGADGYPRAGATGRSLAELFGSAREVNHLFIESTYYGSGYYEFDSTQNFASIREDGNFVVYRELGTIEQVHRNTLDHGQFMPFNDLTPGLFSELHPYNTCDALAQELSEDDPRRDERLYSIPGDQADYYFGVEIEASFMQTADGLDSWGHDIIFEFTGDDDFWLYVDGELVIDLGGIHSALPGKVNFSTGDVSVNGKATTLYDLFRANFASRQGLAESDPAVTARLDGIFKLNAAGQRVFKDYTSHTMRIFYMERGAGASNLRMRFNLAPVTPNQVLLSKEISGTDKQDYASVKFPFQIRYTSPTGEHLLSPDPAVSVTYLNSAETVEYSESISLDGVRYDSVYFLKPGQTAAILLPEKTISYRITECGVNTGIYDSVEINGAEAQGTAAGPKSRCYEAAPAAVADRAQVVFTNHVDQSQLRSLSITKLLFDAEGKAIGADEDDTGFRLRLRLGEELDLYRLGSYQVKDSQGCYCVYDSESARFVSTGVADFLALSATERTAATFTTSPSGAADKIPAGYSIEIRGLLVGTRFMVEERENDIPAGYSLLGYERVEGSYYTDLGEQVNAGTIRENSDPHILVKNQRGWGLSVEKRWSDEGFMEARGDVTFAVYASGELLEGSLRTLRYPETRLYYYFSSLTGSFADYSVREVLVEGETVRPLAEGESLRVSGTPKGESARDFDYTVHYSRGQVSGKAENVRTDTVLNSRPGLDLVKTDPEGKPLAGAAFELRQGDRLIGSFVSDESGFITRLVLEKNKTYTLTETQAPQGYRGLEESLSLELDEKLQLRVSGGGNQVWLNGGTLSIMNRPLSLSVRKIDGESGAALAGAHFAVYRQVLGMNGPMQDYKPVPGLEDLISGEDGLTASLEGKLSTGTYYLVETQAPQGYEKGHEALCFTLSSAGHVSAESGLAEEDGGYILTVANTRLAVEKPVPTGLRMSLAPFALALLGGLAILACSQRGRED